MNCRLSRDCVVLSVGMCAAPPSNGENSMPLMIMPPPADFDGEPIIAAGLSGVRTLADVAVLVHAPV